MRTRPHPCRGLVMMALAGTCALAPAAGAQVAQDEGPVVVGEQRPKFRGVELVRLDASLDFWNQWRRDKPFFAENNNDNVVSNERDSHACRYGDYCNEG